MIISVTNYYVHSDRRDDLCTFSLIGLTLNQLHLYRLTASVFSKVPCTVFSQAIHVKLLTIYKYTNLIRFPLQVTPKSLAFGHLQYNLQIMMKS